MEMTTIEERFPLPGKFTHLGSIRCVHVCTYPESADFRDGDKASGCWREGHLHYEQVCGKSGVYLIVTDFYTGDLIRDDRPWQMKECAHI